MVTPDRRQWIPISGVTHGRRWVTIGRVSFALIVLGVWSLPEGAARGDRTAEATYAFKTDRWGGLAAVSVEMTTGRICDPRVLFRSAACRAPKKVRRCLECDSFLVSNLSEDDPELFVVTLDGEAHPLRLKGEPDEMRVYGDSALVTFDDEKLAWIDLSAPEVVRVWEADEELTPPGTGVEDICLVPGQARAVVSFQKDNRKGTKLGNRLVLLELPELSVVSDLLLPRTHPEWHIPYNGKQQGPGPEVVLISPATNTLLATLDLYGAVLLADWQAATDGQLEQWTYLPTDRAGGESFPDRATLVTSGGRRAVLVVNAGVAGGAVLIDLAARQTIERWRVPPGLEKPLFLPELGLACAVCPGKTKVRTSTEVEREDHPADTLYIFSLETRGSDAGLPLQEHRFDWKVFQLTVVQQQGKTLLLLARCSIRSS